MRQIYFNRFFGPGWPSLAELEPYFLPPPGREPWFCAGGNDSGGIGLEGIDGTEHLRPGRGRRDIRLSMWGNPDLGVLLQYARYGGNEPRQDWFSKGDMSRIREWVRSLHFDPLPVGLFIPFPEAWKAVQEFMATEGQLPKSIDWIKADDLPANTFPDQTVRLPGEPE